MPDAGDCAAACGIERRHYISALFAAFLARHTGVADFHIGYKPAALTETINGFEGLFASKLPLHLSIDTKQTASQQFSLLASQMQSAEKHATYPRDLALRYPELRAAALPRYPIVLEHAADSESVSVHQDAALALIVAQDGKSCLLVCAADQVDEQYALSLKNQFSAFLKAAGVAPGEQLSRLPLVSQKRKTKYY